MSGCARESIFIPGYVSEAKELEKKNSRTLIL